MPASPEFRRRVARALRVVPAVLLAATTSLARPVQAPPAPGAGESPLRGSRQLLLVLTDTWESVDGSLQRFERASEVAPWKPVGLPAPVVVGRSGLAWGSGIVAEHPAAGPVKQEGDGRGPAGVFRLGTTFGQVEAEPAGWRLPYRYLGSDVECVDDSRSAHYNQLVTRQAAASVDWAGSEKMWAEPLYKWGIVVEHNTGPARPGGGSCIFLHLWRGPGHGTAGCTAMAEPALTGLIAWLDAGRGPRLVQLPRAEYARLKTAWKLP